MKNLFSSASPRAIRFFYIVVALVVAIAAGVNMYRILVTDATSNDQCGWEPIAGSPGRLLITNVMPGGVADQAGIRDHDILLAINGKTFKTAMEAMSIINPVPAGTYVEYSVEREGKVFTTEVKILKALNLNYLALGLLGFGFLIVGMVVVLVKPDGRLQRSFANYSILALLTFAISQLPPTILKVSLIERGFFFSIAAIGAIFGPVKLVSFYFDFPVRKSFNARKWVLGGLYVLALMRLAFAIFGVFPKIPQNALTLPLLRFFAELPLTALVAGFIVFMVSYFKGLPADLKKPLIHILLAEMIGVAVIIYTYILNTVKPFALFVEPELLLPLLMLVGVPAAYGYSIFKYRLMDVNLLIKKSIIYAIVTAAFMALYLTMVYGIGSLLGGLLNRTDNQIISILAFLIIAFAFDPLKREVQQWVDRIFYRERFNYQIALQEFSEELLRLTDLRLILQSLVARLSDTMHIERVAVSLCEGEKPMVVARGINAERFRFTEGPGSLREFLNVCQVPCVFDPHEERIPYDERDREMLSANGIMLTVPIVLQGKLLGMINVGPKKSGQVYSKEDMDLLKTLAGQAAISIENARLHNSEIEKQKLERELTLARRIQESLLPKTMPAVKGLEISGTSIPALTVGGDYFDFIQLSPTKLLVVVADVSGKGISAALYMAKVQGMIRFAASVSASPKEILKRVNRLLYNTIDRKSFITVVLALFDMKARRVRICRAGHSRALISHNGTLKTIQPKGIGIGLERGELFDRSLEELSFSFKPKQTFLFYSDGLTEAMNERNDEFGEERVGKIMQSGKNTSARRLQEMFLTAVNKFRGQAEQHDDLTLVVVRPS